MHFARVTAAKIQSLGMQGCSEGLGLGSTSTTAMAFLAALIPGGLLSTFALLRSSENCDIQFRVSKPLASWGFSKPKGPFLKKGGQSTVEKQDTVIARRADSLTSE